MATPTVVLLPVWGAGHLMSMLEAGKRLLARGGRAFSLTVLVMRPPTEHEAQNVDAHIRREEASGLDVRFVRLPAVAPPGDFVGIEEFMSRFVQLHAPHVGAALSALQAQASPAAALVIDFFCTTLLDVARDLAVPAYVYFTANAGMLALFLRLPSLHDEVTVEFDEMDGAVDVPGLPPLPPTCLPNPVGSGHRFLWVLRGPPAPGSRHPSDANLAELLPDGFLERTKGRGLVWPTKAPQKEILAHAAVGGFVTHGGWNSILESLWSGVPMAPWPLYAEQHLNAFTLVAYMGVAVAMKVDRKRNNFVEAAELERAVKELMGGGEEGRKAREKATEMKAACRNAVEEGGSSCAALQRLAEELCTNK